jgi:hypothetical protein
MNRSIDTTQIKQCNGNWKDIQFDKHVTSITLSKQKYAFLNIKKNNKTRYPDNQDRNACCENYIQYIERCKKGDSIMKGKRVSIYDFVRDALDIINKYNRITTDEVEIGYKKELIDTLHLQWKNNSSINTSFNHLIAMVDTSGSMTCNNNTPLYNAIGLGIRIAERSSLGKRVLTFNSIPQWIDLDGCPDFVSCVEKIHDIPWGTNTNFYAALDKILEAYVIMDVSPELVEKYGVIILSDMQIDSCIDNFSENKMTTMFEEIEHKFSDTGLKSKYNTPYKVPFIVFWNLSNTDGFPATSLTKNIAMISGYNPVLLNQFLNKGIEAFKEYNPWDMMLANIQDVRYNKYGDYILKRIYTSIKIWLKKAKAAC